MDTLTQSLANNKHLNVGGSEFIKLVSRYMEGKPVIKEENIMLNIELRWNNGCILNGYITDKKILIIICFDYSCAYGTVEHVSVFKYNDNLEEVVPYLFGGCDENTFGELNLEPIQGCVIGDLFPKLTKSARNFAMQNHEIIDFLIS